MLDALSHLNRCLDSFKVAKVTECTVDVVRCMHPYVRVSSPPRAHPSRRPSRLLPLDDPNGKPAMRPLRATPIRACTPVPCIAMTRASSKQDVRTHNFPRVIARARKDKQKCPAARMQARWGGLQAE